MPGQPPRLVTENDFFVSQAIGMRDMQEEAAESVIIPTA